MVVIFTQVELIFGFSVIDIKNLLRSKVSGQLSQER